jgi:hypothetical protein
MKDRATTEDDFYKESDNVNGQEKATSKEAEESNVQEKGSSEQSDIPPEEAHGSNNSRYDDNQHNKKRPKRLNAVKRVLFFCAGLEGVIVAKELFISEHGKYVSIGLAVLFTACMSGLSGGYAISKIFTNSIIVIPFGVFWSALILNLDRLMLIGLGTDKASDKIDKTSDKKIWSVLSRLLLAIFIGFIVSEPLKLRLFDSEIQKEHIKILRNDKKEEIKDDNKVQIDEKRKIISRSEISLKASTAEISKLRAQLGQEIGGGIGGDIGDGPQAKAIKEQISREEEVRNRFSQDIKTMEKEIDELSKTKINKDNEESFLEAARKMSLLSSMKAMDNLSKNDAAIRNVNLFITALFIVVEMLPVFLKILFSGGVYEDLLREQNSICKSKIEEEEGERSLTRKLGEDKRKIKSEKCDGLLNEQKREEQAKLDRVEVEIDIQAQAQEKLNNFKAQFLAELLKEAESKMGEYTSRIASEYVKNISLEKEEVIRTFTEVYQQVRKERMPGVRQKAKADATDNISKFENVNRKLVVDSLNQIFDETKRKMPEQVSTLSDLIVKDRFEEFFELEEILSQCFEEILSERLKEGESEKTRNYLKQADELIQELDALRSNAIQSVMNSAKGSFNAQIESLSREISPELVDALKEAVRNVVSKVKTVVSDVDNDS